MSSIGKFSDELGAFGSNQNIQLLLAHLPHDPSLNGLLDKCSTILRSLNRRNWDIRKKVLECVSQNLPQLLVDSMSFRRYVEIFQDSLDKILTSTQVNSVHPLQHPEQPTMPPVLNNIHHEFENIQQEPGSTLIIISDRRRPTVVKNLKISTGSQVILGPYP